MENATESAARTDKLVCPKCGSISKPKTTTGGILGALGWVALVPVVILILSLFMSPQSISQNSLFLSIAFLMSLGFAWQSLRAGITHSTECLSCGGGPLVALDSPEGRKAVSDREAARHKNAPTHA